MSQTISKTLEQENEFLKHKEFIQNYKDLKSNLMKFDDSLLIEFDFCQNKKLPHLSVLFTLQAPTLVNVSKFSYTQF